MDLKANVVLALSRPSGQSQIVNNSESGSVPAAANATLETMRANLTSWNASSLQEVLAEVVPEREFTLGASLPDLECIMCNKYINNTPVYQCQIGHLACNECSLKGGKCPAPCSRTVSTRIQNVAVGKFFNSLQVSCKYSKLGCEQTIPFTLLRSFKHEDSCEFAPMECPMQGCNQVGVKNLLHEHLAAKHNVSSVVNVATCQRYHRHSRKYESHSKHFELESSTSTSVLVKHMPSKEFYCLHQESTALGDRLRITPLATGLSSKRKYELIVEVSRYMNGKPEELAYSFRSMTNTAQLEGGLLIPKQPEGASLVSKKRCKIRMQDTICV